MKCLRHEPALGLSIPMILKWLFSRTVRQALQMRKHVWKILQHQRDILSPQAIEAVTKSMNGLRATCADGDTAAVKVAGVVVLGAVLSTATEVAVATVPRETMLSGLVEALPASVASPL